MRAASLALVLIAAKCCGLAGRSFTWSPLDFARGGPWMVPAMFWQDIALAFGFWAVDRASGRARAMWAPYWIIAALAAVDVPVVRVLSSPLTLPMIRATGGALRDSIVLYATPLNLALMAAVLLVAAAAPSVVRRVPVRARRAAVAIAAVMTAIGPFAVGRVETRGLHRNAVAAVAAGLRSPVASTHDASRRTSPFERRVGTDLTSLRGAAAGSNVMLIVLESTGAQYLNTYGAADDPTPTLSSIARSSIQFDRAYASYPESIKGLFALLCSREPVAGLTATTLAASPCDPLPRALAASGLRTGLFHSGRFAYLGMDAVVAAQGFQTAEDAGDIGGVRQSSFGVDEPSAVRRILAWIDEVPAAGRFFVTYLPAAGHHPYVAPAGGPFAGEGLLSAYKNSLLDGDRSIRDLLDGLRSRGRFDNTLLVFLGDHAEAFGQHDGNFGHSLFLYEENVHVPLVISLPPRAAPSPERIDRAASTIDLAPTILDLAGVAIPASYQGTSLLDPHDRMAFFFTDYSMNWRGLRDDCWKYLLDADAGRSYLFDLCADPGERQNLADVHRDRIEAYRARVR